MESKWSEFSDIQKELAAKFGEYASFDGVTTTTESHNIVQGEDREVATNSEISQFLSHPAPNNVTNRNGECISDRESDDELHTAPNSRTSYTWRAVVDAEVDRTAYMIEQLLIERYSHSTSEEEFPLNRDEENNVSVADKPKRKVKRKKSSRNSPKHSGVSEDEDDDIIADVDSLSKRQRKKNERKAVLNAAESVKESVKERKQRRQMERQIKDKYIVYDFSKIEDTEYHVWGHFCAACSTEFTSKNRLVEHLKKSGHVANLPEKANNRKTKERIPGKCKGSNNFYRQRD